MKNITCPTCNSLNSWLTALNRRRQAGASVLFKNASIAALLAVLAFVPTALAQNNDTWVGNTDDTWGTSANWTFTNSTGTAESGVTVSSGDSLIFGAAGSSGTELTNNLSDLDLTSISFVGGAPAYVFSGNSFGLINGITNGTTSAETISNDITLGGNVGFHEGGNLTIAGAISDGGNGFSLDEFGGTLTLSGSNSFGGGVILQSASRLNINSPYALGTGTFTMYSNSTNTILDNTSGGSISNSENNAMTWQNNELMFGGSGNLDLGTNTVTLNDAPNFYVGTGTLTSATLTIEGPINDAFGGTVGLSPILEGANLTLNGPRNYVGGLDITGYGTGGTLTMNGPHIPVATSSYWIIQGVGTVNVNSTENIGGTCFLRTGTLAVPGGCTNTVNLSGTYNYTGSGGIILAQNTANNTSIWNILSGGDFEYNGTANTSFIVGNGQASNLGVMSMYPGSILNINTAPAGLVFGVGRDGGNGIFNLNGGTFTTDVPIALSIAYAPVPGNGVFNFNGGTLRADLSTNSFMFGGTGYVLAGGAIIDDGGNTIAITTPLLTGVVGGNDGGLQKLDTGSLELTSSNAYTGPTTVSGGTLILDQATLATNSTISVASGAILQMDFTVTNTVGNLVLNGQTQPAGLYSAFTSSPYLAGTGSLLVKAYVAPPARASIAYTVSGGQMVLNWPSGQGWLLQSNSVSLTNPNAWFTVTGANPPFTNIVNPSTPAVFYRLQN